MTHLFRVGLAAVCLTLPAVALADDGPWPTDVPGWKKPGPREHPRMLFRKADIAKLKTRAETPEGKLIIARLRHLLDGKNGDTLCRPASRRRRSAGSPSATRPGTGCSTNSPARRSTRSSAWRASTGC